MARAVILGVVEPVSFSGQFSLADAMIRSLKQGSGSLRFDAADGSGSIAQLRGVVPILQPIDLRIGNVGAFLFLLKGAIAYSPKQRFRSGAQFTLSSRMAGPLASVFAFGGAPRSSRPMLIAADPTRVGVQPYAAPLGNYLAGVASLLWAREPIARTTTRLHLASNGQFLTKGEIGSLGIAAGALTVSPESVSIVPGASAIRISSVQALTGGLPKTRAVRASGSGSTGAMCSSSSDSSLSSTDSSASGSESFGSSDGSSGDGGSSCG